MNKLLYTLIVLAAGLVAIFLQGSVLKPILPDFLVPNLILSLVVFLAFFDNSPFGALLVFLLGLEVDFYAVSPLLIGPSAGSLVLVYGVLSSLSQRIYVESGPAVFVMSGLSAILHFMLYSVLIYEFNDSATQHFSLSLANAFATGCATPFVFKVLSFILGRRGAFAAKGHSISGRSRASNVKI